MIDIFIGSSANGEDADIEAVLEYTLRKNSSEPINITWMRQTNDPSSFWHGFSTRLWSTPFSGFRWAIPEYKGFRGKAIYMDCDMINLRNIAELWNTPMNMKPFAARRGLRFGGHEFCVMLIDCAAAEQHLIPVERMRRIEEYHSRCIGSFSGDIDLVETLDPRWNCLDGEDRRLDDIWHLHWTKMSSQPWTPAWFTGSNEPHSRQDLVDMFWRLKQEASDAGYRADDYRHSDSTVIYNIIGR